VKNDKNELPKKINGDDKEHNAYKKYIIRMQIFKKNVYIFGRKQKVCIHQGTMMKRKVAYNLVTR